MSTVQQKSRDFKRVTIEKRGRETEVRVPQVPKLAGDALNRKLSALALEEAHDNAEKALVLYLAWLDADYQLRTRLIDWKLFCRQGIDAHVRATRPAIRGLVTNPSVERQNGIDRASRRNIMEFPIRVGNKWIQLGDCVKENLLEAADQREKSASTMNADAVWFRRIAKELDGKQKVQTVLKSVDVERFRDQAHKDVA